MDNENAKCNTCDSELVNGVCPNCADETEATPEDNSSEMSTPAPEEGAENPQA